MPAEPSLPWVSPHSQAGPGHAYVCFIYSIMLWMTPNPSVFSTPAGYGLWLFINLFIL